MAKGMPMSSLVDTTQPPRGMTPCGRNTLQAEILRLGLSDQRAAGDSHPSPHLRAHLVEGRPKGLFHRTPCSCTLVLKSSASQSDCSMDIQGENREFLDEDENMLSAELSTPRRQKNYLTEQKIKKQQDHQVDDNQPDEARGLRAQLQDEQPEKYQTDADNSAGWNDAAVHTPGAD
ncbi:hypothetical protein EYF80_025642 [Liparis tanakae]|uniref:Uncharacterized protein n=1 Tax=Liparis tanakae TaxID=230148 RepID=A0A4Z2HGW0_9TELE|nr:hypothetical protein EYF80_025642 [Liparis tanakae]